MIALAPWSTWPALEPGLRARGVCLYNLPDETDEQRADRIDTELMALFRDTAQTEAFEALYEHSRGRMFTWLRWLLREQHARLDALDLMQDTYVNVYRYASSFRSDHPSSFRSWVRTIAANVVRRARAGIPRQASAEHAVPVPEPIDVRPGPQLRVVHGEEHAQLHQAWLLFLEHYGRAFDALSPRDRRALELVELEGRTYAETGELLGVGPSNMKMIMLRARRRLQNRMRASMCVSHAAARVA